MATRYACTTLKPAVDVEMPAAPGRLQLGRDCEFTGIRGRPEPLALPSSAATDWRTARGRLHALTKGCFRKVKPQGPLFGNEFEKRSVKSRPQAAGEHPSCQLTAPARSPAAHWNRGAEARIKRAVVEAAAFGTNQSGRCTGPQGQGAKARRASALHGPPINCVVVREELL